MAVVDLNCQPWTSRRSRQNLVQSMFLLPSLTLACLFLLTPVASGTGSAIVRPIEPPALEGNQGTVFIQFFAGGHLDSRARGVSIVDKTGQPVAYRLLSHDPHGQTSIAADLGSAKGQTFLHYAAKASTSAASDPDLPVSLVIRTFASPAATKMDLKSLPGIIRPTRCLGTALIDNVYLAHNPFGPDHHFVTDIEGLLEIKKPGRYRLFSVNDNAGFVMVDGKVVISQASPYVTRDSRTLGHRAASISLTAGVHRIRYVHYQNDGESIALLGYMDGPQARPIPRRMFIHHRQARLGTARSNGDRLPVGFDAELLEHLAHDDHLYTRFRINPIAPLPPAATYRWRFGDGTTKTTTDANAFEHIYVRPVGSADAAIRWPLFLEVVTDANKTLGEARGALRPVTFGTIDSSDNGSLLTAYVRALGQCEYDNAPADLIIALYRLAARTEKPADVAPLAKAFVHRFGGRGGALVLDMRYALASHLARNQPRQAADLFGQIARGRAADADDAWKRTCAAAEQLDLLVFRLGQTKGLVKMVRPLLSSRSPRQIALLKSRLGDVHLIEGNVDKAVAAYRAAQRVALQKLEPRRGAVLQNAYRQTAIAYLEQKRWPALRDVLFKWEADFPLAKLGGDLPLLAGRYFQAIGDDPRAIVEYRTMLDLNPMHPSKPHVLYRLAESLKRTHQPDEARKVTEQLINRFPNSPFARQAR